RIAEIMASTFSRLRTNEQTQILLKDSQKLTEELRAREEEMRQNIEEMNATQEDMQHREVERIGIFTAINNTLGTVEFSIDGIVIDANEQFLSMMGYAIDEVVGKTDRMFSDQANEPIGEFNNFWEELKKGNSQKGDYKRITKSGIEIWMNASYTPAMDKDGVPYKVIELASNITEKKKAELETKRQAEELKAQGDKLTVYTSELEDIKHNLSEKLNEASIGLKKKIVDIETEKSKNVAILEGCVDGLISFNQDGSVEYFNHAAEELWGIQRDKVLGKQIQNIAPIKVQKMDKIHTAFFHYNGVEKEIGLRTEVAWVDDNGKEFDLLATLTRAKIDSGITFTIFAQKISVDLF
ncbi:MAG: PAS domain S-box protein, partial [Bacteroidales bacterium]|nr:PAS domain S-box protein [Bacteroidales bacterium]